MTTYDIAIKHGEFVHKQIKLFAGKEDKLYQCLATLKVFREIFEILYSVLVGRGEIDKIEELEVNMKTSIWRIATSLSSDKKVAIQLSKAIYLIQTIKND